ncbi:arylacetamide deacetylase-like 4 [Anolis carolinensis]|uniref:Alpha/beta hydrolase fold-3 domain-containing protein n=1 Tax=Anolis carolinensis TaxID=28377 RepID=A0A803SSN1_ANOCA|nr:PREDICTED: arylacetamide deacetylase-like 3 [Anolis carolinensis]|eukprot:XP_008121366.2 PREDICTED: arylacetamide deacetylase-like 3 [Anolis carolinensis]
MVFLATLGMLALYAGLLITVFAIAWGIYYDQKRIHIPPGIKHPGKLRLYHFIIQFLGFLAIISEKLGICHKYKALAGFYRTMPLRKSSLLIIKSLHFEDIPVRVYWPKVASSGKRKGVVVISGGAGLFGNIYMSDQLCCYIAEKTDSVVVCIGFRLAPEHPFPIPVMDCCTATTHFLKNAAEYGVDPNCIAVYGESSGGTFATAVCQHLATKKGLPKLRGQVLVHPFLQAFDFNLPSYQQNHSVPILFKKRALKMGMVYLTGKRIDVDGLMNNAHIPRHLWEKYRKWVNPDFIPEQFKARGYVPVEKAPFSPELYELCKTGDNPMFSPLLAEDDIIRQLPETFLITCEYDTVRDDGILYKKRLEDNGVPVTWHHIEDGFHGITYGFGNRLLEYPTMKSHFQHVINFLNSL